MLEKFTRKAPHWRIYCRVLLCGVWYGIVRFGPNLTRSACPRIATLSRTATRLRREVRMKTPSGQFGRDSIHALFYAWDLRAATCVRIGAGTLTSENSAYKPLKPPVTHTIFHGIQPQEATETLHLLRLQRTGIRPAVQYSDSQAASN